MRYQIIVCVFCVLCCSSMVLAADGEKLIFGFEKEEVEQLRKFPKAELGGWNIKEAADGYDVMMSGVALWQFRKIPTTQGQYALIGPKGYKSPVQDIYATKWKSMRYIEPSVLRYTPGWVGAQRIVITFLGVLGKASIPSDWSWYDILRVDAKSGAKKLVLRIIIEDEETQPPFVRIVPVPGDDKWSTVEIDLKQASKVRGFTPKKIVNFTIIIDHSTGRGGFTVDNIRLGKKGTTAKHRVIKDKMPMALPEYYTPSIKPPGPKKFSVKPDRSPLKLEKPIVVDFSDARKIKGLPGINEKTEKCAHISPTGFIGAFDNKHMIVGATIGKPGFLRHSGWNQVTTKQTTDGGKTWKLVPFSPIRNPDHGCSHGCCVDRNGDCVVFTNLVCPNGRPWVPFAMYWCSKTTFTGKGWKSEWCMDEKTKTMRGLLHSDARHCVSNGSCVRLKNGRLWTSWGYVGRTSRIAVAAKYSDDDAVTWHSWRPGKTGTVPGSLNKADGRQFKTYAYLQNCITPYEEHVAVIWRNREGIYWSRFDGKTWSKPAEVAPKGHLTEYSPTMYAVTLGEKDIFLTVYKEPGVFHWDGKQWRKELADCPPQSPLAVSGDKVFAFTAVPDGAGFKLVYYQRSLKKGWDKGCVAATEPLPPYTGWHKGQKRPIAVQQYSPPNFVPVAWSTKDNEMKIKVLRVPVK